MQDRQEHYVWIMFVRNIMFDLVIVRTTGSDKPVTRMKCSRFFPLYLISQFTLFFSLPLALFFQFLKVKISRKNTAYWILSKGRWHLSRFHPCVGWTEWLSRRPLNSIKVWLIYYSTKQAHVSSGTQKAALDFSEPFECRLCSHFVLNHWCLGSGTK